MISDPRSGMAPFAKIAKIGIPAVLLIALLMQLRQVNSISLIPNNIDFKEIKENRKKETAATEMYERLKAAFEKGDLDSPDVQEWLEILEKEDLSTEELFDLLEKAEKHGDVSLENAIYTLLLRRGVRISGFFHFFFIENGEGWEVIAVRDDSEDDAKAEETFALTDEIMTDDRYIASVSVSLSEGEFVVHHQDDDGELITHISVTQKRATEGDDLAPDEETFKDEIIHWLEKMGFKPGTSDQ